VAIKSRSVFLAVSLFALPTMGALAQINTPSSNDGTSSGSVATGSQAVPADQNPNVPGATGDARVIGDPSTIARDRAATADQKSGAE
jgi:hypothetical protein